MSETSFSIQRVYKNSSAEIIRMDVVTVTGVFRRPNTWRGLANTWELNPSRYSPHETRFRWGDFTFYQDGSRKISTTIYQTTTDRVVDEIEIIGSWTGLGSAPDYPTATWRGGILDMSDLPATGDSV